MSHGPAQQQAHYESPLAEGYQVVKARWHQFHAQSLLHADANTGSLSQAPDRCVVRLTPVKSSMWCQPVGCLAEGSGHHNILYSCYCI